MLGDVKPKILFLDDDDNFLEITALSLDLKGYAVDAVGTIERGLQMVKRKQYDIAIVDLRMPGVTDRVWGGMDLISTLTRIDPLIQVIVLTGYGDDNLKLESINRGAFYFVEKIDPIIDKLHEAISYACASRRSLFARSQMVETPFGEAVSEFCKVYPYDKNVFIMMRYYENFDIFGSIEEKTKATLSKFGFVGHLARDKQLSDELWTNVRIYMHSCKYGLGIFEQIKDCDFNPNISLEIGYMYAMGRECLLLKDRGLPRLPSDICCKLYQEFDHEKLTTLEKRVQKWCEHKI